MPFHRPERMNHHAQEVRMKVDTGTNLSVDRYKSNTQSVRAQGGQAAEAAKPQPKSEGAAQVQISTAGRQAVEQAPIRMDVVDRLKAEVDAGTYNPDPRETANKIMLVHG